MRIQYLARPPPKPEDIAKHVSKQSWPPPPNDMLGENVQNVIQKYKKPNVESRARIFFP
jgi:hypothetical protein